MSQTQDFPGRRRLARANAVFALFVLAAGGMVTSTDSGLAVPDWPLSYGAWLPAMTGGIFFEHGHRMVAALLGLGILVMAFWTQAEEPRPGARRLAWATLAAVVLQGVLGGVTVLYGLPLAVSASHAVLAQTLFCALIVMAELVSGEGPAGPAPSRGLRAAALAAPAALWTQLVLGAILRHGGAGLSWHLLGAAAAAAAAGWLGSRTLVERGEEDLTRPAGALLALLGLQLALGLAAADFRGRPAAEANYPMIAAATIHLITGASLLGVSVLLAWRVLRPRP